MKIIRSVNQNRMSILGQQTVEPNVVYVPLPGLIQEGAACYNPLTEEAIIIEDVEKERRTLVQKWYLVPKGFDIRTISHMVRQKQVAQNSIPGQAKRTFTIFTSTACNAHCEYCFERDMKPLNMSDETALMVAQYIERTHTKRQPVRLRWFGGEPLVNKHVIDLICDYLFDHNVPYMSTMSSNGDLFDKVTDENLKRWKLRKVQFTIDDTGDEYDRIKGLPKGAYDRLHRTIDRFSALGIISEIRVHYHPSKGSAPCLKIIKDMERHTGITMYARIVYDTESHEDYENLMKIEDEIIARGWMKPQFPAYSNGTHCMADNRTSVTVGVNGDLSPCEHYAYGPEMYGNLKSKHYDGKVLARWSERIKHTAAVCDDCPLYPSCEAITMCPAEGDCSKGYKEYRIALLKRAMHNAAKNNGSDLKAIGTAPELICGVC